MSATDVFTESPVAPERRDRKPAGYVPLDVRYQSALGETPSDRQYREECIVYVLAAAERGELPESLDADVRGWARLASEQLQRLGKMAEDIVTRKAVGGSR
jgi:hypothetical protein